jgi:hypothetical protein
VFASLYLGAYFVFAAAPTGGYVPGATLNPDCAPLATYCIVRQAWQINTIDGYIYNDTELVGIGTDSPTHNLTIDGDMYLTDTQSGADILFDIGDATAYGGDVGFVRFVGNQGAGEIGFDLLDYNNGDPLYTISLGNGTNNVSWGLDSTTSQASLTASHIAFNGVETFFYNTLGGNLANIGADANTAVASILAQDVDSGGVMFVQADKAGIIYNTISTDLDGAGTPLVMAVYDENERGGGYSARGRNPNYPVAGADMYVWDPALGGDRTYLYMTEESINTSLMLDPVIVGARNNTTNDINEISFDFHQNDPTAANNSIYKINSNFTWSKPGTLGTIMTLSGSTGALTVEGRAATNYVGSFTNDGSNTNRFGLLIQAGEDSGSGTLVQFNDGDGTSVGSITFTGTTTTYGTSSDIRLKDNITDTQRTLQDVLNIKVHDYTFKAENTGKVYTGFIAQELYDIFPDAVFAPTDGRMWSVDYGKITPLLVKAIQELDVKVNAVTALNPGSSLTDHLIAWLGDAGNGIADLFAKKVKTQMICVTDEAGETCLNRSQLNSLLSNGGQTQNYSSGGGQNSNPSDEQEGDTQTQTTDDQQSNTDQGVITDDSPPADTGAETTGDTGGSQESTPEVPAPTE